MTAPPLYGVVGRPVLHSWSPFLFHHALAALDLPGRYLRLWAGTGAEALALARGLRLTGLNVTAPFKEEVLPLLDHCDRAARAIGAVNTVVFRDGLAFGHNTDVRGVQCMIARLAGPVQGARVAVLGAGGAARCVAHVLADLGCDEVLLVNRDPARGQRAARALGVGFVPWERAGAVLPGMDMVIACLAPGALVPPAWVARVPVVLDANYHGTSLAAVAPADCVHAGGAAWLVGQAEGGFTHMTGRIAIEEALIAGIAEARSWSPALSAGLTVLGPGAVARTIAGQTRIPVHAATARQPLGAGLVVLIADTDGHVVPEQERRLLASGGVDLVVGCAGRAPGVLASIVVGELLALSGSSCGSRGSASA